MNIVKLSDEELGYLYGMLHSRLRDFGYRRRKRTESENAAHRIGASIKKKVRKALPRGAARAIEMVGASF